MSANQFLMFLACSVAGPTWIGMQKSQCWLISPLTIPPAAFCVAHSTASVIGKLLQDLQLARILFWKGRSKKWWHFHESILRMGHLWKMMKDALFHSFIKHIYLIEINQIIIEAWHHQMNTSWSKTKTSKSQTSCHRHCNCLLDIFFNSIPKCNQASAQLSCTSQDGFVFWH